MDLERIKQQLRLRSGRSKKPKQPKPPPTSYRDQRPQLDATRPASAGQTNGYVPPSPPSHPNLDRERSYPNLSGKSSNARSLRSLQSEADPLPTRVEREQALSRASIRDGDRNISSRQEGRVEVDNNNELLKGQDAIAEASESQPTSRAVADPYDLEGTVSGPEDFDLRPPARKTKPPSMETMSEMLFSDGHLNTLLYTPTLLTKFSSFLQRYRPYDHPLLMRYLEISKALKAIEYANAVAENAPALPQQVDGNEKETSNVAAVIDPSFQQSCSSAFDTLLNVCLPLYITYNLVRTITECLVDEITGRAPSYMRDMVGGLSEIFCLSDPNQEDNPIIYASEEFYRLTGYKQDNVIGNNCRFLQGPRTNRSSPKRIREGLEKGEEVYETLLNYRRDGRPFINLLMIAPLYDDKGHVKYLIGAQVDVTRLIESGKVLEGFQKHLSKMEAQKKRAARETPSGETTPTLRRKKALDKLRGLSELFDLEESTVVQTHSRTSSADRDDDARSVNSVNTRRRFIDSDASDDEYDQESVHTQEDWKLGQSGPRGLSGKLPGVYEKYMLIRPSPSLRIVFMSPKLSSFGRVVQSPFLSHIAAPAGTLSGLAESFRSGVPVAAKVNFMPQRSEHRQGVRVPPSEKHEDGKYGKACWISATPLIGGDDRIGVWMVVFVEKSQVKAQRARKKQSQGAISMRSQATDMSKATDRTQRTERTDRYSDHRAYAPTGMSSNPDRNDQGYSLPIKPKRLEEALHATAQRQRGQDSMAAYQYQAATPIEEYRSPNDDSRAGARSPAVSAARKVMSPQSPKYGISTEEYVRPTSAASARQLPNRLRISSPSDRGRASIDYTLDSRLGYHANTGSAGIKQDPNHIPPSEPSDQDPVEHEEEPSFGNSTSTRSPTARSPTPSSDNQAYGGHSVETIRHYRSPPPQSPSVHSPRPQSPSERSPSLRSVSIRGSRAHSPSRLTPSLKGLSIQSPPLQSPLSRSRVTSPQPLRSPSRRSQVTSPPIPESPPDRSPTGTPPMPGSPPPDARATPSSMKSYGSGTARNSVNLPAGLGYLDHLRYSGTPKQPSGEFRRSRKMSNQESDGDPWSGTDGCRSPYSVD